MPNVNQRRLADMKPLADLQTQQGLEGEEAARSHEHEYFEGRNGYRSDFIPGFTIGLPSLSEELAKDAAPFLGDANQVLLTYENFSLVMSRSRRLAIYTACNIHGEFSERDRLARTGKDKWFYDGRISQVHQVGDDLYAANELDRGHLVRREDPVWGQNALQANDDTFHFTNCSPQHSDCNQKTWLGLENYILQNARAHELKVAVFTGPVFTDQDPVYRGVRLPRSFWKVVAVLSDGKRSATAYQIKQDQLLDGLEFTFGAYKTYQVSIRKVERLTGLKFDQLASHDGFSGEEAAMGSELSIHLPDWKAIRI